jgi:hypothetical protein
MIKNIILKIVKMLIGVVFSKDLMNGAVKMVEIYEKNEEMTNEQKHEAVKDTLKQEATRIGHDLKDAAINLMIELAVTSMKK